MSTGADCRFTEADDGTWTYWLQDWPYGDWPEGTTYGPFDTFETAESHLFDEHANPGGYTVIHKEDRA